MASLMRDIAEAICFVERHPHTSLGRNLVSCNLSRDVGARVIGAMRARHEYKGSTLTRAVQAELGSTVPLDRSYGAWLADELKRLGMSQRDIAVAAGVDHATISRLIRRTRSPMLSTARKIERALVEAEA